VGGAIAGGIIGSFFHKGLGMSKEDLAKIDEELDGGKAAVGVLTTHKEAAGVANRLASLGGTPQTHEVTEDELEQTEAVSEAAPEEEEAEAE